MDTLRGQFRGTLPGPYFIGYCGEHQSQYPGIVQLAGASLAEGGGYLLFLLHPSVLCSKILGLLQPSTSASNPQARHRARLDEESRRFRATIPVPPPTSSAFTRIRGRRNAGLTPSMARPTRLSLGLPSQSEQDIIERLQAGEGIPEFDMRGVFKKCTICNAYFVASLLRIHIRGCSLGD